MLTITPTALEIIKKYLAEHQITSSVRVLAQQGCSGPGLALAVDEERGGDTSFVEGGLTFLVDKNLLQACGEITVDYVDACSTGGCGCGSGGGLTVASSKPLPGAGSCSCSCGSGGCH